MADQLIKQRGQIKSRLTRLKKYFESIDTTKVTSEIITQLNCRLEKFEPSWDEFNDIQSKLELEDPSESDGERERFEDSYFELVAKIKNLSVEHAGDCAGAISDFGEARSISSGSNARFNSNQIKLPTIKLPTFDGQYSNWLEFRDAFNALVEKNDFLSDIQKFYYLRSSLEKEASHIIKALEVSADNYKVAWQLLVDRYENKGLIIHNHIHSIFELPTLNKESHSDLRSLFDNITKHLRSLKTLGEQTDTWDRLIIHILTNKFDSITRRDWESYEYKNEIPDMNDMNSFLKSKCELLEKLELTKIEKTKSVPSFKRHTNTFISTNKFSCYYCDKTHALYNCEEFLKLPIEKRIAEVKRLQLCLNCFRKSHFANECNSTKCRKCGRLHNSLLHLEALRNKNTEAQLEAASQINTPTKADSDAQISAVNHATENSSWNTQVLLSTAVVKILGPQSSEQYCRALLDSGSQSHFISEQMCKKLKLNPTKVNYSIKGVGQALSNINQQVNIRLMSCVNNFSLNINCLVLPIITDKLPVTSFRKADLNIPGHLKLADPNFNKTNHVDLLLGSNVFWALLCVGQVNLGKNMPTLQKTQLGWIVAGNLNLGTNTNISVSYFNTNTKTPVSDEIVSKFWQLDEVNNHTHQLSSSEKYCETHFENTTRRDATGRFVVKIPVNDLLPKLGDSKQMAKSRFQFLERKLNRDAELKREYTKFMSEYEQLGHMTEIKDSVAGDGYYLPHHAVLKGSSLTTKLRVVFDASAKTDSGVSLNDAQYVGPTIQNDMLAILLRFRKHNYVITADISKMYRQILISPDQRHLQQILWRSEPNHELKCYQLNTVTYGNASAPYVAVRCLYQLALDNRLTFPVASEIIKNDFYVDDLLSGAETVADLSEIQRDVSSILGSAGFELRKWLSNSNDILEQLHVNNDLEASVLQLGEDQQNKTLGVFWNAKADTIQYSIRNVSCSHQSTKRTILATVCQLYDPLGLLGPIIIVAKLIIQELWKSKLTWDEAIPQNLHTKWLQFRNDLYILNQLKLPRHALISDYVQIEMHGFSDSSERAYGACIYIRCIRSSGYISSQLLCAKSRVAPLKQVTLPRLELCGAVLLAQLAQKAMDAVKVTFDKTYFWSDSTIALAWIKGGAHKWKTFVANRVGEIHTTTNSNDWHHVKSAENPADLLSRGTNPNSILNSSLWWNGPPWLLEDSSQWVLQKPIDELNDIPEQRTVVNIVIFEDKLQLFNKFSSLSRLQRTVAYILRFGRNTRCSREERQFGPLTPTELDSSLISLVRIAQQECFAHDYHNLKANKPLNNKSKILSLHPFLDNENLLRVGGRIQGSNSSYDKKHPVLLPQKHNITTLILKAEHTRLLHCGPQQLLYSIREKFWPISGRNAARCVIRKCITCFKARPTNSEYLMGNLPAVRINQFAPFLNVGVDYAGPFLLKDRRTRGAKLIKTYACLFICMCTKAVHLELVSDLTTNAFIATLKRFIARRGKPANIYSDNGLNFVGAHNKISEFHNFLTSQSDEIANNLSKDRITWHFIPARSANFGGIWEAGIKSTKFHLKRVIGNASLNFEDFNTVLTQIEAILNSRPLCPLSSDPNDLSALTPAHFLIGRALTALPELNITQTVTNRLDRFQQLQALCQHFWARWHKEVISELQTRTKWKRKSSELIQIGTLVLVKEENVPTLNWKMGRIAQLHPGSDGITRVISIRVQSGVIKRAVTRVCVLPIESHSM